jgi:hypothetical protein
VVDGLAFGDGGEPGAGVAGHAGVRPLRQRVDQRVGRQILGQGHIPDDPGQGRDDLGRLHPPHRIDGLLEIFSHAPHFRAAAK